MNKVWKKLKQSEIKKRILDALAKNVNYVDENILGIPASYLDEKVFSQDASFLDDAPFIYTMVQNPNHIGCHTLGKSEHFFSGTHAIEREVIEICSVAILKGELNAQDGYIASGGTEANLQAIWIYRNYFQAEENADRDEICVLCSEDSHYSMDKAGNVFVLDVFKVAVDNNTREISKETVQEAIKRAQKAGKKYFIVIGNMMTTMFGSVDNVAHYTDVLTEMNLKFKLHIDGAFGGFYYPFTENDNQLTFQNPHISSFTLDAHKMAQAPYGTGIFLIRKGLIQYANTQSASYVEGEDFTLIGSRSGANAIAVWMILVKHGPFSWKEKIFVLQKRAEWVCQELTSLNIEFYRHPNSNILTIRSEEIKVEIAQKYGLVPDSHKNPKWFKIVIMDHVSIEKLIPLIDDIKGNVLTDQIS